jgi:hypothetical protein
VRGVEIIPQQTWLAHGNTQRNAAVIGQTRKPTIHHRKQVRHAFNRLNLKDRKVNYYNGPIDYQTLYQL